MIDPLPACRIGKDDLAVLVRLTPKGGRDALDGLVTLSDGRIAVKARVRSAPENGEANAALEHLLAKACGTGKSLATVTSGQTSRLKTVTITGEARLLLDTLYQSLNPEGPRS